MRKMKYTNTNFITILVITLILLLSPSVLAGSFKLVIFPPTTPIQPGIEMRQINGVHQLIPGTIDRLLPNLWMSQYTLIEVAESPSWASVSFLEYGLVTPPGWYRI